MTVCTKKRLITGRFQDAQDERDATLPPFLISSPRPSSALIMGFVETSDADQRHARFDAATGGIIYARDEEYFTENVAFLASAQCCHGL